MHTNSGHVGIYSMRTISFRHNSMLKHTVQWVLVTPLLSNCGEAVVTTETSWNQSIGTSQTAWFLLQPVNIPISPGTLRLLGQQIQTWATLTYSWEVTHSHTVSSFTQIQVVQQKAFTWMISFSLVSPK